MTPTPIRDKTVNFSLRQGEAARPVFQYLPVAGGPALKLGGYTVKARIEFPTPLELSSADGGFTILDAYGGIVRMNLETQHTADVPPDSYPYDLWTVDSRGRPKPWLNGRFVIEPRETEVP